MFAGNQKQVNCASSKKQARNLITKRVRRIIMSINFFSPSNKINIDETFLSNLISWYPVTAHHNHACIEQFAFLPVSSKIFQIDYRFYNQKAVQCNEANYESLKEKFFTASKFVLTKPQHIVNSKIILASNVLSGNQVHS